jgi:hypothetical protein
MRQSRITRLTNLAMILFIGLSLTTLAQEDKHKKGEAAVTGTPVLWREPTDIESRDLLRGAGGEAMKPDVSKVTFLEQKQGGYSTKYLVRDAAGNEWIAKLGKEAQSDTAANRLVWAVGYETEIAYLIPGLTIEGKGTFENVRLEARPKDLERIGAWKWDDNPFNGTPQLQGLKIMMLLINNWDVKDANNQILAPRDESTAEKELRYIISDLGGSFGKTGGVISRSRNKPSDFVKAKFIESANGNVLRFYYRGKNKKLFDSITVEDARWIGNWLGRLSEEQIKDAFRAANYSQEEVEALSTAIRMRIKPLAALAK